jgi:hypothetical protein
MSTVTARIEEAQRYRELLIQQLTAPVKFTQQRASSSRRVSRRSSR